MSRDSLFKIFYEIKVVEIIHVSFAKKGTILIGNINFLFENQKYSDYIYLDFFLFIP